MVDDLNQQAIKLAIETDQYSVAPGGTLEIPLLLTNQGQNQDQIRISVEGIPSSWVSADQPVLLLASGEERSILLRIQTPAPTNVKAGRYVLQINATSAIDPTRTAQARVNLTVAGYEEKGRVNVLLDAIQFAVVPGNKLAIRVVLTNQGLDPDTFQIAIEGLPEIWTSISAAELRLEAGEEKAITIDVKPPKQPDAHAGRYPFNILISSKQAPDQRVSIRCVLTVGTFIDFKSSLEPASQDPELPARVIIQNLSNVKASFQIVWSSPDDTVVFEPQGPQNVNLPSGETSETAYSMKLARRPFVGNEKVYPYTVEVLSSDRQAQTLPGSFTQKGFIPVWAMIFSLVMLLLLCLTLTMESFAPGEVAGALSTPTPLITTPSATPLPGPVDQAPLLIGRNWYLVSYNDSASTPGSQEPYTLFNPDGTLIGYTGCKDFHGNFTTKINEIAITNISFSSGTCSDQTLQQQESAMTAILNSASSYFVADTAMQLAGGAGFLNYSLTPVSRDQNVPPTAIIQVVPQALVGQTVVFDASRSSGQAPLVSWQWNFGDNQEASGVIVQHTYFAPGVYTVKLTVTDQRNASGSTVQQISIQPQATATPAPTLTPPPVPTTPPTQTPLPTPTLAPTEPNKPTPTRQPTATPPPTPTTAPPTPTVPPAPQPVPPKASIEGPASAFIGEPVVFNASNSKSGSTHIVSYSWTFGNGTSQPPSPNPTIATIYNSAGSFEVMVTIVDANGLSSTATTHITISARLDTSVWTLSTINGQPLVPGTAITFQALTGQFAGFAGCNDYSGQYSAVDNGGGNYTVTTSKINTGRRACPADIMQQESVYLDALGKTTAANVQQNKLILATPNGELIYYLVTNP